MKKVLNILTIILLSSVAFSSCQKTDDKWEETQVTENNYRDLTVLDFRYDQIPAKPKEGSDPFKPYLVFEYYVDKKYPNGEVKTDYVKEFSAQPPAYGAAYRAVYTYSTDFKDCKFDTKTGAVVMKANESTDPIEFKVKVDIIIGNATQTATTTVKQLGKE